MSPKLATVLMSFCLFYLSYEVDSSFIKPNNIPRVGRSSEDINAFDQGSMGYVIKTNKNIPRMGRRNYDSENHYDIPKLYQMPTQSYMNEIEDQDQMPIEAYSYKQFTNMKR